ncbi:MAG: DUF4900 domain-containing protein, partial [Meiothermus sp.]|nr:DUF4900 domain-containing protein [Meiothermus sp.]
RLHVAGLLGVRQAPWFAGAVTSGSCPALGVDGSCVGEAVPGLAFASQGFVRQSALLPRPDRPCLGEDCPVWGEGVDLALPGLSVSSLELTGWTPSLTLNNPAQRVRLWAEGGRQHLEVCDNACYSFRVNGARLERLSPSGWTDEAGLPQDGGVTRLRLEVQL